MAMTYCPGIGRMPGTPPYGIPTSIEAINMPNRAPKPKPPTVETTALKPHESNAALIISSLGLEVYDMAPVDGNGDAVRGELRWPGSGASGSANVTSSTVTGGPPSSWRQIVHVAAQCCYWTTTWLPKTCMDDQERGMAGRWYTT